MSDATGNKPIGRILITNDDGIDAPGLAVLEDIARTLSDDIWVFAPDDNCSGFGRSLTLGRDLKVTTHGEHRLTCDGTPTDCMILAINHFMKDHKPDLVLSGVNLGMNIADDITCSGTIGAAWEAAVHNVPAIAISQKFDRTRMPLDDPRVFDAAIAHAPALLKQLLDEGWPKHIIMNINFPSVPADEVKGIKAVTVGRHKASDDVLPGEGEGTYRIGNWNLREGLSAESDVGAVFDGFIAICPLSIDMTDYRHLDALKMAQSA